LLSDGVKGLSFAQASNCFTLRQAPFLDKLFVAEKNVGNERVLMLAL